MSFGEHASRGSPDIPVRRFRSMGLENAFLRNANSPQEALLLPFLFFFDVAFPARVFGSIISSVILCAHIVTPSETKGQTD